MPSAKSNPKPSPEPIHQWAFEAIGTQWWIGVYEPISDIKLNEIKNLIYECVEDFDKTYSRFRDDSLVSAIAERAGTYDLPDNKLLELYRDLYTATNGQVTPLIGEALSDAGYDATYSFTPKAVTTIPAWDDVMAYKNGQLTTRQPVLLDFGAAGKGYLVDKLCALMTERGIKAFCIDGSGDMRCQGLSAPLRIGMEHPTTPGQAIGVIELQNTTLCASSPYKRQWGDYHHVLDPTSLSSPKNIAAVWVTAASCALADGLTTALFFCKPEKLQQFTFDYCVVYADSSTIYSDGFPANIFTERSPL